MLIGLHKPIHHVQLPLSSRSLPGGHLTQSSALWSRACEVSSVNP